MKPFIRLFLASISLLFAHIQVNACDLDPTASIDVYPNESNGVILDGEYIFLDGYNSPANCGYITDYTWYLDNGFFGYQVVSNDAEYEPNFSLQSSEDRREIELVLQVRNSVGNTDTERFTLIIVREHTSYYYLTDHLGSVRVTVDTSGTAVGWDDYYPFGLQMPGRTQNASNPNDDQKFTGYELEQQGDLGLYHAGARMYDPVIGRFNSQDRFKEKYPSMSPYQYAALNPISFIDVNGDSIWVHTEGDQTTIHYEGRIINNSEHEIDMEELIGSIQQAFTDAGSDNVSFQINLTEAKSESDLNSTDHVVYVGDVSATKVKDTRGVVNKNGGKVAWVNQELFDGPVGGNVLTNLMGYLAGDGPLERLSRTAMHEMGHQMNISHNSSIGNLMKTGSRGKSLNSNQLNQIIQNYPDMLNLGSNRGVFMPYRKPTIR